MFSRKTYFVLSILLVLMLTLSACGSKETGGSGKDELVVAQGADPKSLDPHASNDQPSSRVNKQIYNTLVEATEDMEIEPGLAESWEQVDETTWRFKLREGVKFHNGEELRASDVKFSLDRMMNSPEVAHIVGAVESVEIEGDYTVIIKTKEPFAPILAHLAHTAASILNEKAVTEAGDDYANNPIGTGPFKFVSHDAGDKVTLERFDDYFGEPAKVNTLIFRNIPEGTNRTIGLKTGEIDIAYDIEPIDLGKVREDDKLVLIEEESLSTSYIGFNTKKAPFHDVRVRKALNHAVNVDEIIEVVLEGAGKKATGPINDKVFGYNKDLKGYEYDPEKAKELLAEAGYPDGFKTTIWTNDSPVRVRIAELVQAQLKEVGVEVTIEEVEWGAYLERTAAGEHDMFILGWVTVTGDADYGLYALFHSSQHGGAGNRTFYTNSEVDKLLDQGRTSIDEGERLEVYAKAQELIVEDAPQLFLYFQTQNAGVQSNVEGFRLHPAGHHKLVNVSFK
ncbi:glutathione ABC transporter substrate-binding protein [Tepidimicrobium xylanilyticum]|uniref:Peptide/nickel transport system substrate-binding protein n=1 Tax=Tepidimicrobium xylanilyticum TaxID=1123352 RepID=A0A1H2VFA0_9FIRM|nr:glutathione ABC transporter substrate-binding protein [Tepidimicrobium xylanilyticum]GMG96651.1 diguanylate phosphodiesterase [Tepidimicrobium xylanilyticum]SDW67013.1 peptide/nickel transport system substrate-binding protein [Tepidimicrobium xylanilyticum]